MVLGVTKAKENASDTNKGVTSVKKIRNWFETHKAPPWWVGVLVGWTLAMVVRVLVTLMQKG